jgi:hypothetical protein
VILAEAGDGLPVQILVNTAGIGILWITAWALAQRNRDIGLAQSLRNQLSVWRSQLQRA